MGTVGAEAEADGAGRAEQHYLRSYEANPRYYWLLADLALFYAGSDRPVAEKRRLVDPLVARLRESFDGEAELPLLLTRIERRLSMASSGHRPPEPPQ